MALETLSPAHAKQVIQITVFGVALLSSAQPVKEVIFERNFIFYVKYD